MTQPQRYFRLADKSGTGVACDRGGLSIGDAALFERDGSAANWQLRRLAEINDDLSRCYGLPVDFAAGRPPMPVGPPLKQVIVVNDGVATQVHVVEAPQ